MAGGGCAGDEHLLDVRLSAQRTLAKAGRVGRNRAQVGQLQSLALYLLYHHAQNLLLRRLVLREKDQSRAVLSLLRHRDALQQYKLMGYLEHDAGSITILTYLRSTVPHVLKHLQRIIYQLVTLAAVDVDYHAHTAGIVLVFALIQSSLLFTFCHIILS